jgi:ParB-like chromosome segregation protein Spo0J
MTDDRLKPRPRREMIPVHPAAEMFPLLPPDELRTLADKIRQHGILTPLVFVKGFGSGPGSTKPPQLIDGRNRLDALELLGLPTHDADGRPLESAYPVKWLAGKDPFEVALALNCERRHLNQEQKRGVIAKLLKAKPELSDREIAKMVGVDHKTVAAVRREANGEIPHKPEQREADGPLDHKPKRNETEANGKVFHKPEVARVEASGRRARGRKPGTGRRSREEIAAVRASDKLAQQAQRRVESGCGAVVLGRPCRLPPLSSGGALVGRP